MPHVQFVPGRLYCLAGTVVFGPVGVLEDVHVVGCATSAQSLPAGSGGFFAAKPVLQFVC
jgi:hypothetical protein